MRAELVVVPVLLPLLTAGLMLWAGEGRCRRKAVVNVLSTSLSLAAAVALLAWVHQQDAAAAFFDLGVFTVVVGSTFLLLSSLAHQSMRARRQHAVAAEDAAAAPRPVQEAR